MSHTQGKLRVGACQRLYTEDGRELAVVTKADPKLRANCAANAARLAKCWNSHDALVEACKAAERLSAKVVAVSGLGARHEVVTEAIVVRDAARAAIAKAEGGAA